MENFNAVLQHYDDRIARDLVTIELKDYCVSDLLTKSIPVRNFLISAGVVRILCYQ